MQFAPRPIAAFAVVGALSLLAAGCSAGGDPDPSSSTTSTRTASAGPSSSSTATPTATAPTQGTAPSAGASDDVPSAFPGSGQTNEPDVSPSDFPATAVVSFAGWDSASGTLQAGGLVSGTTNATGTCTFTATKGGVTRALTSAAQASASSVNCAQVAFPAAQVSSGTWSITLEYAVGDRSTDSEPMTAEVP